MMMAELMRVMLMLMLMLMLMDRLRFLRLPLVLSCPTLPARTPTIWKRSTESQHARCVLSLCKR